MSMSMFRTMGQFHDQNYMAAFQAMPRNRTEPARVRPPAADVPFVCDYSLSERTADYSKWGLRA